MSEPAIVWLRQDLRTADNRALSAAARIGCPVLPVYVLNEPVKSDWPLGGASRWWLHGSLSGLDRSLRKLGSRLVVRHGDAVRALLDVVAETGAKSIHFTRCYEPAAARMELELKTACDTSGVELHRYTGALLHEPEAIRSKSGEAYRVFTPFWRAALEAPAPRRPAAAPKRLLAPRSWPESLAIEDLALLPRKPDWAGGLRATWEPGEAGAARRLGELLDGVLETYSDDRDRPDRRGTSMLSPHLHFGEIGPAQVWHAVAMARARAPSLERGAAAFLREIGWREFSYHLLHHWPHVDVQPFRPEFRAFPWTKDAVTTAAHLVAWQRGSTGYPIVDAGMRQLWQTGWMHNRVRMIVASFLTKHLLIPWQEGATWFWDTLVDADLANNAASWQWVAGCGADAAPYFRVFNPELQGAKFDPDGAYVRRFVGELAGLPVQYIHAPWKAPQEVLADAGVRLGESYPLPIVEHAAARERALAAYASLKGAAGIMDGVRLR